MHPGISCELRVKRCRQYIALPDEDGARISRAIGLDRRQHLDASTHLHDHGGPDEHSVNGLLLPGDLEVGFERVHLPAERVAFDDHVENTELGLLGPRGCCRQKDETGAGPESRHPRLDAHPQRIYQSVDRRQPPYGRRLAPGNHQRVHKVEIFWRANFDCFAAEAVQNLPVFPEVALESQYPNGHDGYHARRRSPPCSAERSLCKQLPAARLEQFALVEAGDVEAGHRAGCQSILVKTGYGSEEMVSDNKEQAGSLRRPAYVAENILEGLKWILERHLERRLEDH